MFKDHINSIRAEDTLRGRLEFEKFIAKISAQFIRLTSSEIDNSVNDALRSIGNFIDADRCYIFLFSESSDRMEKAYEWSAQDEPGQANEAGNLSVENFPWLITTLKSEGAINISDVANLPSHIRTELRQLHPVPAQSLLLVSMNYGSFLGGFLGLDALKAKIAWPDDIVPLFKIVAEMFMNALGRNRVEEALRQSEERFRQVITSISDHVYFWKVTKEGEHVNLYLSPNVEELTGYPYKHFLDDWSFWNQEVIHPEDRDAAAVQAAKLASGQDSEMEYRLLRADGEIIWVRDSGRVQPEDGAIFVYGVVSDVTERKKAEEALAEERALLAQRVKERTAELSSANAELSRANRLKDEFLAAMSHELRTPLNAVLGMSEALQEEVYGPLNEKQMKALHRVEDSGRQLLSLINDILDLSRIEAGKMELQVGPVDLDLLCQISLKFIYKDAREKRLQVSSQTEPGLEIQADERRLKQVLVNLLSNAVKFTPEEGKIGLEVESSQEQDSVRITVWDTGIGIAEEDMKQLFKPFVQLDSRLSRHYEGTGLGLTLVYRIVEMHQGSISVQSKKGEGSRFSITLPCSLGVDYDAQLSPDAETPVSVAVPTAPSSRPLVLLVEDNEANIATISDFLQAKDYRVSVARDGAEALERAREDKPAIILMDIQMPMMDGLEATRRIRADSRLKDIPVIGLTALDMPGDRERSLAAGVDDYLSKPISLKQLTNLIKKFVN